MVNLLKLLVISCSLLLVSAVGYASDGEKTTKSEVVILSSDQLAAAAMQYVDFTIESEVIYVIIAKDPVGVFANVEINYSADIWYTFKKDIYEAIDLLCYSPILTGEIEPTDYGIRIHNKGLYNSKINKGYTHFYKSDLIRSNCSYRSSNFS